jgi:hypothetical protein
LAVFKLLPQSRATLQTGARGSIASKRSTRFR